MNAKIYNNKLAQFALIILVVFASCKKDPYDGVVSNEKSIENFMLGDGFTQIGAAVVDREEGVVKIKVLVEENTDFTKVKPIIQQSYGATVSPNSGEEVNFLTNDYSYTYQVVAESGESRQWKIEIEPFEETLTGEYTITDLVLYGGTGPEYGGGGVFGLTTKPWLWADNGGPQAELDNKLTFTLTGVTPDGKTPGKIINDAGADGLYADFKFVLNPATDVNHFYRKLPKGEGIWERDYTTNVITFIFEDGTRVNSTLLNATTENLGNNLSKTIANQAFVFALNGTDDWDNIYQDYDKVVKKARRYWIEIKKIN